MHVIIPNQRILNVTEDHWTRRNSGSDRIRDTIRQWISRRSRVGRNFTRSFAKRCVKVRLIYAIAASLDPLKYMAGIIIIQVEKGIGGRRINRIHGLHNLKLSFHASHAYVRNEIKEENIWRLINNVCHQRCYCQLQIFLKTSLLYFKFTKISNPLPSPSSKNLLQIQKLVTISRKIFSKESAGREISLCNARISFYPSLRVIPAYGRYPTVGRAKIVQLVPFPKVVHPARWAALGGVKYTRGRGAISVIPSRQILGYRTFRRALRV